MKKSSYIYLATLFLGFHYYLIIYTNSSFLSKFVGEKTINLLYIAGALINIGLFIFIPYILKRVQTKTLTAFLIAIEFLIVFLLARATGAATAVVLFILQQSLGAGLTYCLDLFLEAALPNEHSTGRVRSYFLTCFNIALIISLVCMSFLVTGDHFKPLYTLSSLMLVPIFVILATRINEYRHGREIVSLKTSFSFLRKHKDTARIIGSNIVLQFFYSIMVIYLPLLLRETIGFSWQQIAFIFIIMILPFLIFEIPVGRMIDTRTGEKEFLFLGFIIMAAACFTLPLLHSQTFWLWAAILFISRIGAALVEISNESYFFKKVDEHHPGLVSIFRMTQPAAYVLAPAIAIPLVSFIHYGNLFFLLGVVCLLGLFFIPKVDTR